MELAIPLTSTVSKGITAALADEHVSAADGFACEKCNAAQFAQQQRQRDATAAQRLADARTHAADSEANGEALIADAEQRADATSTAPAAAADDDGDDDDDDSASSSDDSESVNSAEEGGDEDAGEGASEAGRSSEVTGSSEQTVAAKGAGWGCISTAIESAAQILVVHVKRFRFSPARCAFVKDDTAVHVDDYVTLSVGDDCPPRYGLVGVVHHHGSLDGGHYTATVKSAATGQWLHCSDDEVTGSHSPAQTSRSAYLAVYAAASNAA